MENITPEKSPLNGDRMRINISAATKAELEGTGKGGHPVLTASFGRDGVTIEPAVASLEPYRVDQPTLPLKNAGTLNAIAKACFLRFNTAPSTTSATARPRWRNG